MNKGKDKEKKEYIHKKNVKNMKKIRVHKRLKEG